jgi:parallel beta-helix repeat protein
MIGLLEATACGGGSTPSEPTVGALEVTIATTGDESDADGYILRVDDAPGQRLNSNGELRAGDLTPGSHEIQLSDLAANCAVAGDNPRVENVAAGETTTVTFNVLCSPSSISISPGQSIQAAVNANPAGTRFLVEAGTHIRQSVIPKSGDHFIGEPGTVLDGQGVAGYAFAKGGPPYPSGVTIRGLKVTGYVPDFQAGAIDAGGYSPSEGTLGWIIDSNEVSYNGEYGIRIGNSTQITNNKVHHNHRLNIGGSGHKAVIESNEIAFGNYLNTSNTDFEAGGTKFTNTDSLLLHDNDVHDNLGVGLWIDLNNINTLIDGNRIDGNASEGIAIEISYKTTISNNTVTNNGWHDPRNRYTWLWNAGIGVHASQDVEVYGNTVSGNYAGIVAIQQDRTRDPAVHGAHIVQNLYVHDNSITQSNLPGTSADLSVAAGAVTDIHGDTAIFTIRNNHFRKNSYYLGQNASPFAWLNRTITSAEWNGYGQDQDGSFNQ